MRLLLDTHVFLWCIYDDHRITKSIRTKIMNAAEVYVSSASIWEAAIKIRLKKLEANIDQLVSAIEESEFIELPITIQHVTTLSQLPIIHRDPFDRIMIAQAVSEPLTFLTADAILKDYSELVELI